MSTTLRYFLNEDAQSAGVSFQAPRELDAGFDLPCINDVVIAPGDFALVDTGIHFSIPEGWVGFVKERSSIALKGALVTAGVIDASYRGTVRVAMHNLGKENLAFQTGERIAQIVFLPHLKGSQSEQVYSVELLGDTDRGAGGFGSTGK